MERGSRWILYSSFQLLLKATVADAFLFLMIFIFPNFIFIFFSGIWGSYVIT